MGVPKFEKGEFIMGEWPPEEDGMSKHDGLPVSGYNPQSPENVAAVNYNKELEERALRAAEAIRDNPNYDGRMAALAITQIQQGFMWLNRAVFQPSRIELPEDK